MKILCVHNFYRQAGGEDVVFRQEQELLRSYGHYVVACSRSNHEIDTMPLRSRLLLPVQAIWASDSHDDFARLLRAERPDVVHVHNTFLMLSPSIFWACHEQGVPVVQTLHNYRLMCPAASLFREGHPCEECVHHGLWRGIRHGCYRDSRAATATVATMLALHRRWGTFTEKVSAYIALTETARRRFITAGLPAEKITVKPNFIFPDPGQRANGGEFALFIGRIAPEKGLATVLRAWARLGGKVPLRILGDGPLRPALQKQAAALGLKDTQFLGFRQRPEALAILKRASFLLFPSEWYENFPMTLVEAFACGVPVIASRLGAMDELVLDGRNGLLFQPGCDEDLAQKVNWAWNHPQRMGEIGDEARRIYEAHYTGDRNYELLMNIYRKVVAAPGRAAA